MALWQYTFQILPKESFEAFFQSFKISLDDNMFDETTYWQIKPFNKSYFERIGNILQKSKSWSEEIDLYGNQESNCFEVFFDGKTDDVTSVSFRINFTSDYEMVLNSIIEFCILKGLIVLDEELQLVPLNFESIRSLIENAPQVRKYNQIKKSQSPE